MDLGLFKEFFQAFSQSVGLIYIWRIYMESIIITLLSHALNPWPYQLKVQ